MQLRDYLRVLTRRWITIVVVLVACLAGSALVTVVTPPTYESSSTVLISIPGGGVTTGAAGQANVTTSLPDLAAAFARIASTPPVLAAAAQAAGVDSGVGLVAVPSTGAATITVTVSGGTPQAAEAVAASFSQTFPSTLVQLNQLSAPDALNFAVISPPTLATSPTTPDPVVNTLIGLVLGLALGLGAAVAREALDRRIRDSRGIEERLGVTVLGVVPNELGDQRLPAVSHPDSRRTESYRKIRTNLLFAGPEGLPPSIAVTSALAGEGKTSLAANLAAVCAQTGQQVAVVDADLRQPTLHQRFGVANEVGLSNVLAGELTLGEVATTHASGITVIPSGPSPRDPSAMLEGRRLREVIDELARHHDIVIVDTTPVLAVSDASQVCAACDGAVVVSRLRRTTFESLRKALTTLDRVKSAAIGVVAVGHDEDPDAGYRYYYSNSASADEGGSTREQGAHRHQGADNASAARTNWRRGAAR